MNIGILGGSFDPVHNGHMSLAKKALRQLKLDALFFLPAYMPPHKNRKLAPVTDRKRMLKLAAAGNKKFSVSDYELKNKSKSYTYKSLRYFRKKYPGTQLYFIMGSDSAAEFGTWRYPGKIRSCAEIVIGVRAGHNLKNADFIFLKGKIADISSTAIREKIKKGVSLKKYLPPAVERYIKQNGIYGKG